MKQRLTRILALSLLILMISSLVLSCADKENNGEVTTTGDGVSDTQPADTDAETTHLYPEYVEKDYGGAEFHILRFDTEGANNWNGIPGEIVSEGDTGDYLASAVYARNLVVEERFKVKIVVTNHGNGLSTLFQNDVLSGDSTYSLVMQRLTEISRLYNLGLIASLDNLDVDFSMPWYDQNSVNTFTMKGKLYSVLSDITFTDKLSTVVTFYNKTFGETIGMSSLYQTALDGNWTLDKMLSYAPQVSSDANNDGKMDQNDVYCISAQNDGSYYFLNSAGIPTIENDGENITFSLNTERAINALEKIFGIMNDTSIYFNRQTYSLSTSDVAAMFANNQALFMVRPLQSLYDLRAHEAAFEVIPMPKFYDTQESYYAPVNPYASTAICIPVDGRDYERTGLVLDLMAAESHYRVMPDFYNVVLDVRLISDDIGAQILDIVFENRIYDLGIMWNFGNLRSAIVVKNMTGIASTIKGLSKAVDKAIEDMIKDIENLKN